MILEKSQVIGVRCFRLIPHPALPNPGLQAPSPCVIVHLVRIFKVNRFSKLAEKEGITDSELKGIVNNVLEAGKADADLGGGVYKIRIARPGEGKSGGFRVIVFFRSGRRTFFHYIFAKSDRANISRKELKWFKELAHDALSMTEDQINMRLQNGTLQEI
jgi:hypothetical protein